MIQDKKTIILLILSAAVALFVIILAISSLFTPVKKAPGDIQTTPGSGQRTSPTPSTYTFTPLQKTTIQQTTDKDVETKNKVVQKTQKNGTTIYLVESPIPLQVDEIRTREGRVIFESTSTETVTLAPLPKITTIEKDFGKPEDIINGVAPFDRIVSAYLYPSRGFVIFANRVTKSVYRIQRFLPMSLNEYKKNYAEYLMPAAPPKGEGP